MSDDELLDDAEKHVETIYAASLKSIRDVISDFHMALDLRENGGTAGWKALLDIQKILDMPWVQGVEQTRRRTGK